VSSPAWENLDAFLQTDDFATRVIVTLKGGGSLSFSALFDDPFLDAQLGEYNLETSQPRLTCKLSDVPGVARGDTVVVDGTTFDILSAPQSDGAGMAILKLSPRA
jgi:hypothetical protein